MQCSSCGTPVMPNQACGNCGSRQTRASSAKETRHRTASRTLMYILGIFAGIALGTVMSAVGLVLSCGASIARRAMGLPANFTDGCVLGSIIGVAINALLVSGAIKLG